MANQRFTPCTVVFTDSLPDGPYAEMRDKGYVVNITKGASWAAVAETLRGTIYKMIEYMTAVTAQTIVEANSITFKGGRVELEAPCEEGSCTVLVRVTTVQNIQRHCCTIS